MNNWILKQSFSQRVGGRRSRAIRPSLSAPRPAVPDDRHLERLLWTTPADAARTWICFWRVDEVPFTFVAGGHTKFDVLDNALFGMWEGLRFPVLSDDVLLYASGRRVPIETMKTVITPELTREEIEELIAARKGLPSDPAEREQDLSPSLLEAGKLSIERMFTPPTEEEDNEGRTFERHDWLAERVLHLKGGAGAPDTPVSVKIALPHLQKPEDAPRAAHLMEINNEIWACPVELSPFMGEGFVYGPDRISAMHAGHWFLSTALEVLARKHSFETPEGEAFRLPFQDHFIIPWDEPPADGIPTAFVLPEWSPLSV